jgi:hypothetical protein
LLVNQNNRNTERNIKDVQEATGAKGVQLSILKAGTESDIDAAFGSLVQLRADALVVATDPFLNSRRDQLVALASRHAVPAIYYWREFATVGGLISYGPSLVCPTAALSPIATSTHGTTSIPISTEAPSTNVSCNHRRRTGNQSNASANTDPAITGSSRIQTSATGSSITSTIAPRDGPSLQPDQGPDMKTRLANHTCRRAATASGRLSRYFI